MVNDTGASDASLLEYPSSLFTGAVAVSINNFGQIVGGGILDSNTGAAVGLYWTDALATPVAFPSLAGETIGLVQQVGDSGVVVRLSRSATGSKAVAWRVMPDDSIVGPLVLPTRSRASAGDDAALGVRTISSSAVEIVGRSAGAAVAWNVNLTSTGLKLNGGASVLDSSGEATHANGSGSICGQARGRVIVWGPLVGKKRTKTQLQYDSNVFGSAGRSSAINDLGMVSLEIQTGSGDDNLFLNGVTVAGPANVTCDAGNDRVRTGSATNAFLDSVSIDTGIGSDLVVFDSVTQPIGGSLTIRLGGGADILNIVLSTVVLGDLILDGGGGYDELWFPGEEFASEWVTGSISIQSFEAFFDSMYELW